MRTHRIKLLPIYFDRIISGQKTFEVRKNDRDYQVGDVLSMYPDHQPKPNQVNWMHSDAEKRNIEAKITYLTTAYQQEGYCVLGIKVKETTCVA